MDDVSTAAYAKIRRRLIPFLIACYLSAYLDRSNLGIAKLQFTADLRISEFSYGIAAGLFYLGYCLFEIPSNLLLRRIGARRTFFRILVLWSTFTVLLASISGTSGFYTLRFLIGAAEAGFFPGVLWYLSCWVPSTRRARFTAWFMSAMALSGCIGGPLSALILSEFDGRAGLRGWQWLFIVEGLPGIALGVMALRYLPESPADARWLTSAERSLVQADLAADRSTASRSQPVTLWQVLADSRFYSLAAMSAAIIGGIGGVALWMPTMLRASGITSAASAAALSAIPYGCALVCQQWIARRSDRTQERRLHAGLTTLIGAAGWLLLPLANGPLATLGLLSLTTAAMFAATGPFWALPATCFAGAGAAAAIAAVTTCGAVAAFVSPIVVGWAATHWNGTLVGGLYYGLLLLAGGLSLLLGSRDLDRRNRIAYRPGA